MAAVTSAAGGSFGAVFVVLPTLSHEAAEGEDIGAEGAAGAGKATIQTATGIGSAWMDGYSFDFQQSGGVVTVVASSNGVPVATNSAPVISEDYPVVLDFRALLPASTNTPSKGMLFRIAN